MIVNSPYQPFTGFGQNLLRRIMLWLDKKCKQAIMPDMKRDKVSKTPNAPKSPPQPKTYDPKGLRTDAEVLRELLHEAIRISDRMAGRGIETVTIPAGKGSEAYERVEKDVEAWLRGLRDAFKRQIKTGNYPPEIEKPKDAILGPPAGNGPEHVHASPNAP
jgi:hypothetical protein